MKQLVQLLLTGVFCSCISLGSCNIFNDDPKPKTELEKLPPATQEGRDTFGCLVNGKAWYTISSTNATAHYQLGSLGIGATIHSPTESIGFYLTEDIDDPPLSTGTYNLLATALYDPIISQFKSLTCKYGGSSNRADIISGELTITKFDKTNYIISGLFEFTITHDGCETLVVTAGRFDLTYAP